MNEHDVAEQTAVTDGWTVRCACGATFTATSRQAALDRHAGHHGVMTARAALGDGRDAP